jgi:hypothetical protein
MNKYVIGYFSEFQGELLLEEVEANSAVEAMTSYLEIDPKLFTSVASVHNYCANTDCYIEVLQINKPRSGRQGGDLPTLEIRAH